MSAIDARQFAVDLQALGIEQLPHSFYAGHPVFKVILDVAPFDLQADLSQLLFPASRAASNLSLGELRINQIDVSGTTLWIWTH